MPRPCRNRSRVNIIDTSRASRFTAEVERSMRVLDWRTRVLRRRRRAAQIRNRVRHGDQIQGSAHRLCQQDGPHGREFRERAAELGKKLGAYAYPVQLPIGA